MDNGRESRRISRIGLYGGVILAMENKIDDIHIIVKRIDQRTHEHSNALELMGTNMKIQMTGINDSLGKIATSVEAALEPDHGYVNQLIGVLSTREKNSNVLPLIAIAIVGAALLALVVAVFRLDLKLPNGTTLEQHNDANR